MTAITQQIEAEAEAARQEAERLEWEQREAEARAAEEWRKAEELEMTGSLIIIPKPRTPSLRTGRGKALRGE